MCDGTGDKHRILLRRTKGERRAGEDGLIKSTENREKSEARNPPRLR
jgi:hypothetical protein